MNFFAVAEFFDPKIVSSSWSECECAYLTTLRTVALRWHLPNNAEVVPLIFSVQKSSQVAFFHTVFYIFFPEDDYCSLNIKKYGTYHNFNLSLKVIRTWVLFFKILEEKVACNASFEGKTSQGKLKKQKTKIRQILVSLKLIHGFPKCLPHEERSSPNLAS